MRLVLALLLAFFGLAAGIQYPLSYEYDYYGEIKAGMPELRYQFAGTGLKAKLLVTVASEGEAHVQISDARAGTMNGLVPSSGRAPLPISSYTPLKDAADLQKSFTVHFSGRQEKLEVPEGELLWHSNLRKAIVSLLRVPYVLSSPGNSVVNVEQNRILSEGELPKSFKKEEQTVMGTCNVLYTLTKAAPRDTMQMDELHEDAQPQQPFVRRGSSRSSRRVQAESSASSASPSYRMVRSVDFYDCRERVVLKKSTHGNLTEAGIGQLRGIQSRSSVGEYLLSGEPTSEMSMRIEKAIIEGVVTMNPFGHETKKLMTICNQTLTLMKVSEQPIVPKPSTPMKQEPWAFRVESPYRRAPNSQSWISFKDLGDSTYPIFAEKDTTGYNLTADIRSKLKTQIHSLLDHVTRQLHQPNILVTTTFGGSADGVMTQKMAAIVSKVHALPLEDLREIYDEIAGGSEPKSPKQASLSASQSSANNIRRELLISALKVSGSGASIKLLIERMHNNDISAIEASNIFSTMKANIESSAILPDLVDYVMSIPDDASVSLKSSSLINLSSMLRRMCLNLSVKNFSHPVEVMGTHQCHAEQIVPKYVQYLEQKLKSVSKVYLKAIYVQALANIGDLSAVRVLGQVAQEESTPESPSSIRLQAIQGLSKNRMLNTSYSVAHEILLGIAEAQVEPPIIREAALASLFTLPKNATFWQRLALSTWREPSARVASFQYSMIRAMAHSKNLHFINQISMAKHVLPQAKPQPRSPSLSALMMSGVYNVEEDMGLTLESFYLVSSSSLIPEQMNFRALSILGGMKLPLVHVSTIGKGLEHFVRTTMDKLKGLEERQPQHKHNFLTASKEWEEAAGGHKMVSQAAEDESLFFHMHILKHIEIFSPITKGSLEQMSDPRKSAIASAIDKMMKEEPVEVVSYYNPMEAINIFPSEIGLPIMSEVSRPTLVYSQFNATLNASGSSPHNLVALLNAPSFNISGSAITKVVQKREGSLRVLVPWVNKTLLVGIDNEATFSLPAEFFVSFDKSSSSLKQFQFGVKPSMQEESAVLLARNLPFTLVRDLLPDRDVTELPVNPITPVDDGALYNSSIMIPMSYTGLDAQVKFSGDFENPLNASSIMSHIQKPSKLFGLVNSVTARFYQLCLLYNPQHSQTKEITGTVSVAFPLTSHTAQASNDQRRVVPDLSAEDTMSQRLTKLAHARISMMVSASLNLTGTEPARKYEATLMKFSKWRREQGVSRQENEVQFNLMRSKIPSVGPSPMQTCISCALQYPRLPYEAPLTQVLQSNMDAVMDSDVYTGQHCTQENKDFTVQAFQRVSEVRKRHLEETQSTHAESSVNPPLDPTQAVKSVLVYDTLDAEIKEVKPTSDKMKNITNHISDIVHGYLFPLVTHNSVNVKNTPGVTIINATRSLGTDRYTIWTRTQSSICLTQGLRVAPIMDYLSPLNSYLHPGQEGSSPQQMQVLSAFSREQCVIKPDSVMTFSKVHYSKSPFNCSTLAVKTDSNEGDRFVILTKPESESASADQEIKIIYPKEALTILIQKDAIMVNGAMIAQEQKEVKSEAGKSVAMVAQSGDRMKVKFQNKFSAELKAGKEIVIKLDSRFRSKMSGMCGRFSQQSMGDLRDSKQCLYKPEEGAMFAASWVATSEMQQCKQSSPTASQLLQEVATYQQHCPKTLHSQAGQRKPRRQ